LVVPEYLVVLVELVQAIDLVVALVQAIDPAAAQVQVIDPVAAVLGIAQAEEPAPEIVQLAAGQERDRVAAQLKTK
jgi:hypothetical protein